MKKTLSILAVAALTLSTASSYAKEVVLKPYADYVESPTEQEVLAPAATLVNTESGMVVVYDLNDASVTNDTPFAYDKGTIYWGIELANVYREAITLDAVSEDATDSVVRVKDGDVLVLDFTDTLKWGGPTSAQYTVIMFRSRTEFANDFAEWYSQNGITIVGRFNDGDYIAYAIDDTCDYPSNGAASTYGGLVFFNESVAPYVQAREIDPNDIPSTPSIPEPTTATLSLLALAGLAARRRRKA